SGLIERAIKGILAKLRLGVEVSIVIIVRPQDLKPPVQLKAHKRSQIVANEAFGPKLQAGDRQLTTGYVNAGVFNEVVGFLGGQAQQTVEFGAAIAKQSVVNACAQNLAVAADDKALIDTVDDVSVLEVGTAQRQGAVTPGHGIIKAGAPGPGSVTLGQ